MKTHDLAKAMNAMAKILRAMPNQELDAFGESISKGRGREVESVGVSLSTLAAFSKYSKADWQTLVSDFELPIEINQKNSSRDVMGKILAYLADNDEERVRVARKAQLTSDGSSELSSALSFLLNNG